MNREFAPKVKTRSLDRRGSSKGRHDPIRHIPSTILPCLAAREDASKGGSGSLIQTPILNSSAMLDVGVWPYTEISRSNAAGMSLNINLAYPLSIVTTSDRRITRTGNGQVLSERSTKLTAFACADAKGTITYNGIGWDDDGNTPSEWILEIHEKTPFATIRAEQVLELLRSDAETRIGRLSRAYPDRRHTFAIAAWHEGQHRIYTVSNYEYASNGEEDAEARPHFDIDSLVPVPGKDILIMATGAIRKIKRDDLKRVAEAAKNAQSTREIRNRCAKIIKDVSYRQGRKGSVGTSVQWVVIGQCDQDLYYGLDLPGGTTIAETPNLIGLSASLEVGGGMRVVLGGTGSTIKDTYVETTMDASQSSRYDLALERFRISESSCEQCGAKIPEGYQRCPVCDAKIKRMSG